MQNKPKKKLLFELSGEHQKLPYSELIAVLSVELPDFELTSNSLSNKFITIETRSFSLAITKRISSRLAMSHSIYEFIINDSIFKLNKKNINDLSFTIKPNSTFKLNIKQINKSIKFENDRLNEIKNKICKGLIALGHSKVDVKSPEYLYVLFIDSKFLLTRKLFDIERSDFETRKPQNRPYFAPISLHPRLARCLVNLARIRGNDCVLDPFCGTGGILLEAGLMGHSIIGSDIDNKMIMGTEQNLSHYGIKKYSILNADVDELPKLLNSKALLAGSGKILGSPELGVPDAIVTEPPYGRATTTKGESLKSLIKRAFYAFSKLLKPNQRLIISLPDKRLGQIANDYFSINNVFELRIHKSLTKYIFDFSRK